MFDEFQWVLLEKVLDLLCEWRSKGPNSTIWNLTPCLMWTIQRERNQWTFEHVERTSTQLQASLVLFMSGCQVSQIVTIYSYIDLIHKQIAFLLYFFRLLRDYLTRLSRFNRITFTHQKKVKVGPFRVKIVFYLGFYVISYRLFYIQGHICNFSNSSKVILVISFSLESSRRCKSLFGSPETLFPVFISCGPHHLKHVLGFIFCSLFSRTRSKNTCLRTENEKKKWC